MRLQIFNGAALAVILALATWGATRSSESLEPRGTVVVASPLPGVPDTLVDARQQTVATADYQRIVSVNITAALLQWKGIEATQKISESQNTKVVFVGNSASSLPVILGGQDGQVAKDQG